MRSLSLVLLLALTSCDGGSPEEIERICAAATECGSISASDTDRCISDLDGATPDSATRAAAECADCVDSKTCGEISDGDCVQACKPLRDTVNGAPGTATGGCTSTTTSNFAIKSNQGNLMIRLDCTSNVEIIPGPYFDTVGTSKACGKFYADAAHNCPVSTGTVAIAEKDGRRWVKGTCACSGLSVTFDVPLRINF